MKKQLLFLSMMLLPWMTYAYDAQIDGIYYDLNSEAKSATVTCLYYESPNNRNAYYGDIIIPNEVAYNDVSYSVTSIGNYAFYQCSGLTSITIPESVTSIGSAAFYGCYKLNTIYCLNTTPPTCSSVNTFVCSTGSDAVRNVYDVYNYATLHVPMGSGEVYSSAYEWRYFNKIKEDMEANGNVYYANLTVKQGETGYIRQAIKAAESYKIFIGSLGGNKVNAVSFNGVDVTSEVANGYYTTPLITGESILSISYEISPSAVKDASLKNVKVIGNNGEITISNIDEPSSVSILTIDGKLVGTIPSALGSVSMAVPIEQVYVVRVGTRSYKIAL